MTVDRSKLLAAAARVYGEYGFRGATTRRIADEAGVNEITIFRQFGSKESLINEAIRSHSVRPWPPELPAVPERPERPEAELSTWCAAVLAHLSDARSVIGRMIGEMEERPDVGPCVGDGPTRAARPLLDYVGRPSRAGISGAGPDRPSRPLGWTEQGLAEPQEPEARGQNGRQGCVEEIALRRLTAGLCFLATLQRAAPRRAPDRLVGLHHPGSGQLRH